MNCKAVICFCRRSRSLHELKRLAAVTAVIFLAGCASEGPEGLVAGASTTPSPAKTLFEIGDLATELPKPKDFVLQSRPSAGSSSFIPVHQRPPARPEPVLTADGVKQQQAALDTIRKQHDALSGRPVAAPGAVSKPKKPKKTQAEPAVPPT